MKTKYRNIYFHPGASASSAWGKVETFIIVNGVKYVTRIYFDTYDTEPSIYTYSEWNAMKWFEWLCNEPEKHFRLGEFTVTASVYEWKSGWKKRDERVFEKISATE